jgi:tetratricopeptide (TPR) repeat protein
LRGNIYLKKHYVDTAILNFNTALLLSPKESILYSDRADAYYELQMPDESIEDYTTAIKYMDDDMAKYELISNRGNARGLKRDFEGAYKDYKTALDFDSTNVIVMCNIGGVLGDLGREKEAIMYLEKALKLSPNEISAIGNLGLRYIAAGDYKKAVEKFNRIIELSPDYPLAYNNMGYAKYKMNKLKEALKDIEYSIQLFPDNSYAYKNRALVYLAMKQTDKACADLMLAASLGYTMRYGNEVQQLIEKHCIFKNL